VQQDAPDAVNAVLAEWLAARGGLLGWRVKM
jgi:hypothetical protein